MNEFEKSAIIGYWRSGAQIFEIHYLTGISRDEISLAIKERKLIYDVQSNNDKAVQNKIKVQKSNKNLIDENRTKTDNKIRL